MTQGEKGEILAGLNAEQAEAVLHGEGPLLIIAGAGTGKTTVITRRIAYLIASKRAAPEEILALTFTDKAAAEMEERVDLLVPYGYVDVWISTFHAFGDHLLREHALKLGLTPAFRLLTRPEQLISLRQHLFELPLELYRPLGNPLRYLDALATLISRAKDEDVDPVEYGRYAERLAAESAADPGNEALQEEARQQGELARTYQAYQGLMAKEGLIDFGDQVQLALRLLRDHPVVLQAYHRRFRYILVDEFQDTNYTQFQLVKLLAAPHSNITVVGDDDQSIYKFRGAAISNLLGFMESYPQARQVVLTRNYRSPQVILDAAYRLIGHNNPDRLEVRQQITKHLTAQQSVGAGEAIYHRHYDTVTHEADGVATLIAEQVGAGGYRFHDCAILVRSNNDADPFLRSLNMRGIPYRFTGNQGLYSRPEVRLLIAFLRVTANPEDSLNLYYLACCEPYALSPVDLTRCMNYANRHNLPLRQVFCRWPEIPDLEGMTAEGAGVIARLMGDLDVALEGSMSRSVGEVLYDFITRSGYLGQLTATPTLDGEEKIQNIARFFQIVQRAEGVLIHNRVPELVTHLDLLMEAGDDPAVAEADVDTDAVHVLTVHKAKGLEFPLVFLVGLVQGRFPWPRRREAIPLPDPLIKDLLPSGDFHVQEERRLFYVGMTRACRELYLTSARDYGGSRLRKVSQFVLEALDLPVTTPAPLKASALQVIGQHAPLRDRPAALPEAIPDDQLLTLSYLQVDDYLTCPLKYKYVHLLRVPILQHHTVMYGKVLHDAVRAYHRGKLSGEPLDEEGLLQVFERGWVSAGFLTREHEEQRLQAGRQALRQFFRDQEQVGLLPTHVEKEFTVVLGHNRVVGRWDRIDVRDGEVTIIDYKSSQVRRQQEADRRCRESLQLTLYALAYAELSGQLPERLALYFLESGLVGTSRRETGDLEKMRQVVAQVADGIRARRFEARPSYQACRYCAYQAVCPHTAYGSSHGGQPGSPHGS